LAFRTRLLLLRVEFPFLLACSIVAQGFWRLNCNAQG
jgi:hypothetical protein